MSVEEKPSTPSSGGGKLESLSKEDLIKFAKRQTILVAKAKGKIDELSKKTDGSGEIQIVLQQKDELEGRLNLSRQENETLQHTKEDLQSSNGNLQKEKDNLQKANSDLQKEKEDICRQHDTLQQNFEEMKEKYEEADEERLSAVEAYQMLQKTLEQATTEKTSLYNQTQGLEEKVGQMTNQLVALREENECLKLQHTSTLESVKAIQSEYQKLSDENMTLSEQQQVTGAELEDANKKKDKLIINFKALKQKYLEMKKEMDTSRAESPASPETSPRDSSSQEDQLKAELESLKKENTEQKVTLDQLRVDYEQQQETLLQLRTECEEKSSSLSELESERSQLKQELTQQRDEFQTVKMQLDKSEQLQQNKSASDSADMREELETRIGEWKEKVEMMRVEYEEKSQKQRDEIVALNAELERVNTANNQSKERVEELVLGLGKESAGVIAGYEEKMATFETERAQLLATIHELSMDKPPLDAPVDDQASAAKESIAAEVPAKEASTVNPPAQGNSSANESATVKTSANESATVKTSANESVVDKKLVTKAAMTGSVAEKDATLDSLYQDLRRCKEELAQEKHCTKSLQDTMKTLSATLKGLEEENAALKSSAVGGEKVPSLEAEYTSDDRSALFEHIRVMGIKMSKKEEEVEELGGKLSELVNYLAKLKTKCKMLLEANDQLTTTVEQQERRLMNDARGARNLELHFQETENNVNEQIAHFHEERDQMIARVQDYASNIERLRLEMLPFKEQEKQCVRILCNGIKLISIYDPDAEDDPDELPMSNLVGLAKLLVSTALKFRTQLTALAKDHDRVHKSDVFMKRLTLNWRKRFEEEAWKNRNMQKRVANLEAKIAELGGDSGDPEEGFTEMRSIKAIESVEPLSHEDMESDAARIQGEELSRLYKHTEKCEKEIRELKMELGGMKMQVKALSNQKEDSENTDESGATLTESTIPADESDASVTPVDVRPKGRALAAAPPKYVSKSAQTEETGVELEDKAIQGLRETIASLRSELKASSDVSDELAAIKGERSQEADRIEELTKQLAIANTSIEEKDVEVEYLLEVIQRHKTRIEQQAKNLEELSVQLNKNSIQDKFHLQVGDTQQSKLQASLSAAYSDLQKSNDERDAMCTELEQIRKNFKEIRRRVRTTDNQDDKTIAEKQALLDKTLEEQSALSAVNADLSNDLETLKNQHQELVTELEQARAALKQKEVESNDTQDQVNSLRESRDEAKGQIESLLVQLNDLLDKMAEQKQQLDEEKDNLTKRLSKSESDAAENSSKAAQLTKELEESRAECKELLIERSSLSESLQNVQDKHSTEISRMGEERKILQEERDALQQKLGSYKSEIEKHFAQIMELRAELDEGKTQHEELLTEKSSLSKAFNSLESAHSADVSRYENEKEHNLGTIRDLEEVVSQFKEEQHLLNDKFIICQDQSRSLEAQVLQLKNEHSIATQQMTNQLSSQEGEMILGLEKKLQMEKDKSSKQLEELAKQKSDLCVEIEQLKLENSRVLVTARDYQAELEQKKENLEKSSSMMEELKIEHAKLLDLVNTKDLKIQEISEEVATQREENEKLGKQVTALTGKENAEELGLRQDLEAAQSDNEELKTVIEVGRSELDALKTSMHDERAEHQQSSEAMLEKLEAASLTTDSLQKTNQDYVEQLETKQAEIARLTGEVVSIRGDLEQARKEMMEMSSSSQTSAASEEMASHDAKRKELEDRANKFKLLALKAKKELAESKATVDRLKNAQKGDSSKVGEMQTLIVNYQHLQENVDRLQDDLDTERSNVSALKGQLEGEQTTAAQLQGRITELVEERENQMYANNQLQAKVKALESHQTEWNSTQASYEKESDVKQMEIIELNKHIVRLTEQLRTNESNGRALEDKLRAKINELELKVHEARDELEQANKKMNKNNVMDLEIADFERTVSNLESQVRDKVETITNLQQELDHQRQTFASVEQQLAFADEQRESVESRHDKLQQMLNKTKQELDDAKQQETETKTTDLAVRGELEILMQQYEDAKIEISRMSAQKLAAEDKLKSSQDAQQRLMRSMENKQRALQADLESSRKEVTVVHEEYDGYKVRVHSVLKQQQTRASVEAALESEKIEKDHIQEVLAQVKIKLQETSDKLQAALSENGLLQDELDKLSLKHNKLNQEMTNKETVWRQRLDQLMLENSTISAEHSSSVSQMNQHTEIMTETFKEQMRVSQSEHEQQIATLNSRIGRLEAEKNSLVLEVQTVRQQLGNVKPDQIKPVRQHSRQAAQPPSASSDIKYNVRESGEGMEHPNPSQVTGAQSSQQQASAANTLVGLEQLLTSPDDDAVSMVSLTSTAQVSDSGDEAKLRARLQLSEKQLDHLRELLNDSEATCLRYNEQVKLLKQEIRRLESNQQRENSISNMEYLKNIVYKFLSLESGDERSRLLPVLNTMLKFNDEELSILRKIAQSNTDSEATGEGQAQGAWSGYLHRWTGFSS